MVKQKSIWECSSCGQVQKNWTGNCMNCSSWNSFFEKIEKEKKFSSEKSSSKPVKLQEVSIESFLRYKTFFSEVDRILGNGIVKGSLILIAGEPGIGKSTLLLQICSSFSKNNLKVLYISGEESIEQTALRAKRLKIDADIFMINETEFSVLKKEIDLLKPDIIIVDSIQILYKSEIASIPGSVSQIREIATEFMHLAKGKGISVFLVGHVTKSGEVAGPKVLEHLVDVVLDFEGDRQSGFRMLRAIKNRFGPTDDLAIFKMKEEGLLQIENPSHIFLQKRIKNTPGSIVVSSVEGAKSILIEIQSLVSHSAFQNPSRRSTGIDQNRLALLLAVLEKKVGFKLYNFDVFVSIAGGLKVFEPAIDLGILIAISSSFLNISIDFDVVVIGEVGLSGEVRSVKKIESRVKEAVNMGFKRCVVPKNNIKGISKSLFSKINIFSVESVEEAISYLLK